MSTFHIHPKELADLLANAVDIGKDKATVSINDLVMLSVHGAFLYAYGRGRYTAGRDWREFSTDVPLAGRITITEAEAEELASVLRGVEGAGRKGTVVNVELTDRAHLHITTGTDVLCELPDADPNNATFGSPDEGEISDWEEIEELLAEVEESADKAAPFPAAFALEVLTRLNKIRAGTHVADFASHPSGRLCGVALGSSFRALVAGCEREGYSQGGKWGDGPGKPDHLWGYYSQQDY